jgi:UPF0755 protein
MSAERRGFRGRALLRSLLVLLVLAALAAGAAVWWAQRWVDTPLQLSRPEVQVTVERGASARDVAKRWTDEGVQAPAEWLYQWFLWSGDARRIRAGTYAVSSPTSPRALLQKMVDGDEALESVRLIEGWTFSQFRAALTKAPHLTQSTANMSEAELMAAIGAAGVRAEGRFFPDTYRYARGTADATVLKRAYQQMQQRMNAAWEARVADLPLKSAEQALILASIVEKETGRASDRAQIAGVFINRLRIDMPLQTDPTVIYGLGDAFDGNLRKRDLQTDTPFNTYTRRGLPPTPIAMPGAQSLLAAVQPGATRALYFVARGDGSSAFSESLAEHNRAVNQYQRRGSP